MCGDGGRISKMLEGMGRDQGTAWRIAEQGGTGTGMIVDGGSDT